MFRINGVHIRNFGSEEYPEFECSLQGESLFIHGTNNTGKTTTLDGLLYSIFGYRFIDRAANPTDESEITLSNGDMEFTIERKYNQTDQLTVLEPGEEQIEISGHEDIFDRLVHLLDLPSDPTVAKLVVTALVLPQRTEDAPLRDFSNDELKTVILTFASGKETSERIGELEDQIEEHELEVEDLHYKRTNLKEEIDDDKIVIQRNNNYLNDLEEFISVYQSGEIFELQELFKNESQIKQQLDRLYSERTSAYDELFKTRRKIGDLNRYYDKDIIESAKETLSVLTCPVCSSGADIHKVESRKRSAHCPFCGIEEYSGELYETLEGNIEQAEEQIEELRETASGLEEKIDELETQIKEVKKKDRQLSNANPIVVRVLRDNPSEKQIGDSFEELEQEYSQLKQRVQEKKAGIESNEESLRNIGSQISGQSSEISELKQEKTRIEEEVNRENIDRFNEVLDSVYSGLINPLDHSLYYEDGQLLLDTGNDVKDCSNKHTLGYSQRRIVDVALWLTFHKLNRLDEVTAVNFSLFDDIFENIDNNQVTWKDNLISSLRSFKENVQLLTCSIDSELNSGLNCQNVKQLQYQTDLSEFN